MKQIYAKGDVFCGSKRHWGYCGQRSAADDRGTGGGSRMSVCRRVSAQSLYSGGRYLRPPEIYQRKDGCDWFRTTGEKIPEKLDQRGTGKEPESADRRKIGSWNIWRKHQITVVMTRTKDEGLADSQVEDLKARVELIDKNLLHLQSAFIRTVIHGKA